MNFSRIASFLASAASMVSAAGGHPLTESASATYIANEGVLVADGETKVLFDPLFQNSYGHYRTPSAEQRAAMLAGEPPFNGVDAVFISHAHGDHFTPEDVNAYLAAQGDVTLVAPAQAVAMLQAADNWDDVFAPRVGGIDRAIGDDAAEMSFGDLTITAVRIPHAGWPARADVENLVYRVTLNAGTTVMHLGDADPNDDHYAPYDETWDARETDLALPPYWFLTDAEGRAIMTDRLHARRSVGVHVPVKTPVGLDAARDKHGVDFFRLPGETRIIRSSLETPTALPPTPASAYVRFIANEAVMIADGGDKALIDPFFHDDSEGDQLAPAAIFAAMLAGEAPFNDIGVIMITHRHADHFDAADLNDYLARFASTTLIAPPDAVALLQAANNWRPEFAERIKSPPLDYGESVTEPIGRDGLNVSIMAIPHHGFPEQHGDLQHWTYRVETAGGAVVTHLGDAQTVAAGYEPHAQTLAARRSNIVLSPVWFLRTDERKAVLDQFLNADETVAIHIPAEVPEAWRAARDAGEVDFFADPGEVREIQQDESEAR